MTSSVGPAVGSALGTVLRDRRDRFNALAVEARLLGGGFAEEAFTDALRGPVDALAEAVDRVDHTAVGPTVEAAYRAALTLTSRGVEVVGRGGDAAEEPVAAIWARLPEMAGLVAADPVRVLGSVTNATLSVAATPGVDVAGWVDRIGALGARLAGEGMAGVGPWLAAGRVAAWTCGMAHQRDTALAAIDGLPPSVVAMAVGLDEVDLASWTPTDRWSRPPAPADRDDHGYVVGRPVGGFVGFGGPFTRPPRVWVDQHGAIHATGGPDDGVRRLHADAFGTTLLRASHGTVPVGPGRVDHWPPTPIPRVTSLAATDDTFAVTTSASHRIVVTGRTDGVSA